MIKFSQITTVEQLCQSQGAATGNQFVDGLMEFIRLNTSNSIEDAAAYLGIPQRLLCDAIKFFVGTTPREVIHRYRSYQALDLLDNPQLSTTEVARRLHFASSKVLEAVMRNCHGTTVTAYRTGKARRNGNYDYNQTAEARQNVIDNAKKLKQRSRSAEE